MMKGTVWCVGVCDFWHCLSWPYFHISAYLCTFSVFLHFPTLLYLCISVTVLQICVGVCTIMVIAATWCRRLIATTSNWFALQITASPLFAFLLCFVNIYFFSLQITALPSFSTSSPQCFPILDCRASFLFLSFLVIQLTSTVGSIINGHDRNFCSELGVMTFSDATQALTAQKLLQKRNTKVLFQGKRIWGCLSSFKSKYTCVTRLSKSKQGLKHKHKHIPEILCEREYILRFCVLVEWLGTLSLLVPSAFIQRWLETFFNVW